MLKEFIKYYKPYRKLFLLDFTCAVIVAILELAFPVMVHRVIDEVFTTAKCWNNSCSRVLV